MERSDLGLVVGVAGFVLGGVAVFLGAGASKDVSALRDEVRNGEKSDEDSFAALGSRVEKLDGGTKDLARRVNGLDVAPRADRMKELEDRVAALEARGPGTGAAPPAPEEPKKAGAAADADLLAALQVKIFSGEATADEQAQFWAMLREKPEILADIMKKLEKAVADNPRDSEARMKLSRAYIAKLLTVPAGPEQGAWSMKAMAQYKTILEQDPNHWAARFHLAFNYSQWPDFLNKTPDAIREFETLRKIQETQTPDPEHAQTYLQLSKLYLKTGKSDLAKEALEEGARRFPNDEELKKALDAEKK